MRDESVGGILVIGALVGAIVTTRSCKPAAAQTPSVVDDAGANTDAELRDAMQLADGAARPPLDTVESRMQPRADAQAPDDPLAAHRGLTYEINVGAGGESKSNSNPGDAYSTTKPFASVELALGVWIHSNVATTLRVTEILTQIGEGTFIGPTLQLWAGPNVWIGGGIGWEYGHGCETCPVMAFDFRAGLAFPSRHDARNALTLSIQVNSADNFPYSGWSAARVAAVLGYLYK